MDYLAQFFIGAGVGCLLVTGAMALHRYLTIRKFRRYLQQLTQEGAKMVRDAAREVSELTFRDKEGELHTVKIIVDHSLKDDLSEKDMAKVEKFNLQDMLSNHKVSEDAMGQVEEFVFSAKAVQDMKAGGMEPDDLVRQMLKAAGRIT